MIIIGLGNPGTRYTDTYHNAGFSVIDVLSEKLNVKVKTRECKAVTGICYRHGVKIVLAKPQTFMNLSGESVRELAGKYGGISEAIIVYDDIDLPAGAIRLRAKGSAGTHNGMRSVIGDAGTENIKRLRVGIGAPPPQMDLADYVLSKIRCADGESPVYNGINAAADKLLSLIDGENFVDAK